MVSIVVMMVSVASADPAGSAAPSQSTEWTIDPPVGWQPDPEVEGALRKLEQSGNYKQQAVRRWAAADQTGALVLLWVVRPLSGNVMQQIEGFDAGFLRSHIGSSKRIDQPQRAVGSALIRDTRVDELNGVAIEGRIERLYQPAADGLHVLTLSCIAKEKPLPCDAALDGVRFAVANPISLDAEVSHAAGGRSNEYMIGAAMGRLCAAAIAALALLFVLLRLRRARRDAAIVKPDARLLE